MNIKKISKKELIDIYSKMYTSRTLDYKQINLLKQGKGYFHIAASGHEACQVAASKFYNPKTDYSYPYYRDQAFCMGIGMKTEEILSSFFAKKNDPNSYGRQMPQHYSHKEINIVTQSSPTGTQFLQAVGTAFAIKRNNSNGIVYVSSGEGTASQGDFHEALNWSSRDKASVIFHIEDNGYAISVPISDQIAGGSVYQIASGYENLMRINIDGTDYFESFLAFKKATDRAREGLGPSIIISKVVRLFPHSSSDDQKKYRTDSELKEDIENDPISKFKNMCIESNKIKESDFKKIDDKIESEVSKISDSAESFENPDYEQLEKSIFSVETISNSNDYKESDTKVVLVDAINQALNEEMKLNDKMLIYGQDIAGGKGGVFTATRNLSDIYGDDRVFNAPLAESSIIGTAIGMAVAGFKPVVEIQFGDYIWTSMMQIRNELATIYFRSNGDWSCPVLIRVPVGGYIHGALCHSQSIEGYFAHLPGIKIAYPSNAFDAKGLLKMACRMNNPVLYLEHKGLYRQQYAAKSVGDNNHLIEFGIGSLVQSGDNATIVTWGAMVQKCSEVIRKNDLSVDLIDIRTIYPLDEELIFKSVQKTSKVLIVHEDNITGGFGAEISSRISEKCFEYLDAPIKRVGSKDIPISYSEVLENYTLVQNDWIEKALLELINY